MHLSASTINVSMSQCLSYRHMAAYVVTSLLSHVLPITALLICSQVSTFVVSPIITCKTA